MPSQVAESRRAADLTPNELVVIRMEVLRDRCAYEQKEDPHGTIGRNYNVGPGTVRALAAWVTMALQETGGIIFTHRPHAFERMALERLHGKSSSEAVLTALAEVTAREVSMPVEAVLAAVDSFAEFVRTGALPRNSAPILDVPSQTFNRADLTDKERREIRAARLQALVGDVKNDREAAAISREELQQKYGIATVVPVRSIEAWLTIAPQRGFREETRVVCPDELIPEIQKAVYEASKSGSRVDSETTKALADRFNVPHSAVASACNRLSALL